MELRKTSIPGCFEIFPKVLQDERGFFVKTFHEGLFAENGLATHFAEEYYTFSRRNVLRGLHFQLPPHDHAKLVYCIAGEVLDAVVDLRVGSPVYGRFETFTLSAEKSNMIYIPSGLAHGFYVAGSHALLVYHVTTAYSPEHDAGIHWNSAGIPWPGGAPILSKRDSAFLPLNEFKSPFKDHSGI